MGNWTQCQLGDALTLQRGFDLPSRERTPGTVPIISSSGITGKHDCAKVRGPGVVTGRYGTLGEVFYVKEDFWPLNTTLYVRDFKRNDPLFMSYLLRTLNLSQRSAAAAVPGLDRNVLHLLPVVVPAPFLQRKIAAILSAYDNLIENNTRRIALLEEMAQALYREWFVEFRFPGHEAVGMINSSLGTIPNPWHVCKIADVAAYINQKCIRGGKLSLDEARTHKSNVPSDKQVRFGDVLINSTGIGTLGRTAQVYQNISNCTVDTHVTIVRPVETVDADYFGLTLLSQQDTFDRLGIGSTGQTELSRTAIGQVDFLLPEHHIQHSFGDLVSPMRHSIVSLTAKNSCLRTIRDHLLPKLISGEVNIESLDIAVPEA